MQPPLSKPPAPARFSMPTDPAGAVNVRAVLGPTNTGKTHFALERLAAHRSGMIGFPLRLLARENYERLAAAKGREAVALITGEERIAPPGARYFVCTVESMPVDRSVACLAVDEIQLAADPERGHIFTDRLLHARGTEETLFLGADTIRPLLLRLIPNAELIQRTRLSSLTYTGHKRLVRLPPRSAIVAFSAADVYAMAEQIRRQRGGAAIVMGALSPRTRNAQVALYQNGEVDYLVATDAIGMGLNMDIDHVAFARLTKFDGMSPRRLRAPEVAQIAGRAGRHVRDGTFGTTGDVGELPEDLVEPVQEHRFQALRHLMWRNSDLDFRSAGALLRSLEVGPTRPGLVRAPEADDHQALRALARDADVAARAQGRPQVARLWEVCQIPDFRKTLTDAHTRLLAQVYLFLSGLAGRLPDDWMHRQVERLDNIQGDIDTLTARLAGIRTFTYIAHRADWLDDPNAWQARSRAVEDRLSDALHERLTQRFVDKRTSGLVRGLAAGGPLAGAVTRDGAVLVEGHPVGQLTGLSFRLEADVAREDQRALTTAVRRALRDELLRRVTRLAAGPDADFKLEADGRLTWQGAEVARLARGPGLLQPGVDLGGHDLLDGAALLPVRRRLETFLQREVAHRLAPLLRLAEAPLEGAARGLAFQLHEGLGTVPRALAQPLVAALTPQDRLLLRRLGVKIGPEHIFLPALAKPAAAQLKAWLWAVAHDAPRPPPVPLASRTVETLGESLAAWPAAYWQAIGFPLVGALAIRVDRLDALARELAADAVRLLHLPAGQGLGLDADQKAPLALEEQPGSPARLAERARRYGLSLPQLETVLPALGWKRVMRQAEPEADAAKAQPGTANAATDGGATDGAPLPVPAPVALWLPQRSVGAGRKAARTRPTPGQPLPAPNIGSKPTPDTPFAALAGLKLGRG